MAGKTVVAFEATLESNQAQESVKSFKQRLKEATAEVNAMTEKFGATSREAAAAAKNVAKLKDTMGDAKALAETFNPDKKFVALSGALVGATSGFAALQGAMGLFGAESEDLNKQLVKVQSAMALAQGISGIAAAKDSFELLANTVKNKVVAAFSTLKGAVLATGIGALAVGVGLLIANFDKLKVALGGLSEAEELAAKTQDDFNKGTEEAIKNVTDAKVAFDLAKKGVISKEEALATYNETLGDSLGRTNDLTVAEKNLTDKAEAYIKITGLKAQANALFALSAQQSAKAVLAASDDQISFWDKTKIVVKGFFKTNPADLLKDASKAQAEGVTIAVNDANANADLLKIKGEELLKQAGEIGKQYGVNANISGAITAHNKRMAQKVDLGKAEAEVAGRIGSDLLDVQKQINADIAAADESAEWARMQRASQEREWDLAEQMYYDDLDSKAKDNKAKNDLALEKATQDGKVALLRGTADAMGALADLAGKDTAAGKILAIAQASINAGLGISEVWKAKNIYPEPFGTAVKIASGVTLGLNALKTIKQIKAVQIPGQGGGGGGSIPSLSNITAPIQPQGTSTLINQSQINQIGNAAARAYVIESDVSGNQERVRRLNRAARIN